MCDKDTWAMLQGQDLKPSREQQQRQVEARNERKAEAKIQRDTSKAASTELTRVKQRKMAGLSTKRRKRAAIGATDPSVARGTGSGSADASGKGTKTLLGN